MLFRSSEELKISNNAESGNSKENAVHPNADSYFEKNTFSEKDIEFLSRLEEIMNTHIDNPELNVDYIVSRFNLSRTNFFHKLKSLTGRSPINYIKEARMNRAALLIKENKYSITEIAYKTGFNDPLYFSKSFKSRSEELV